MTLGTFTDEWKGHGEGWVDKVDPALSRHVSLPDGRASTKRPSHKLGSIGGLLLVTLTLLSCAGTRPADLGPRGAGLAPCPSSPNCVCSDDERASHHVLAIELGSDPAATWRAAREVVADWPRTMVVTQGDDYLHAECASAVFGFVDDFELQLRSQSGVIAVRSASRVGYSDMGVNRRRVEALRDALVERGVID